MSRLKEMQRELMLNASKELFFQKGIDGVTISDIAKELGIGEATVYRYFGKKQYIVIECCLGLWQFAQEEYLSQIEGNTGYEKIESFFNKFITVFEEHIEFYRFIAEFDSYIMSENLDMDALVQYEQFFSQLQKDFTNFVILGLADHSLREDINYLDFYNMSTHAVLSLCKKLALGKLLRMDDSNTWSKEVTMMNDALLQYIKK